jgi:asparagine synthetase B (glutamine-hydrolysing)
MDVGGLLGELASVLRRDRGFFRDLWRTAVIRRLERLFAGGSARRIEFIRDESDIEAARAAAPVQAGAARPQKEARGATLDQALRKDVLAGNMRAVLALTDRNAMAHSIEARVPYVDRRVVEFAFRLPDRYKIGEGQRKLVLRRVGARHLPAEIVSRVDRIGFGAPTHEWLVREFDAELTALPDGPAFRNSRSIDRARLRRYVDGFLSGRHRDAGTIWRLYAVDQWARAYAVTGI